MREIKFRAWDNQIGQMHYINSMGWDERFEIDYINIVNDKEDTSCFGVDSIAEEIKIMQYTGLKDKNGIEIYEGDIVKTKEFGKDCKENLVNFADYDLFKVEFQTGGFYLINATRNFTIWMISIRPHKFEVVGNIHDNPELLQEDNCINEWKI